MNLEDESRRQFAITARHLGLSLFTALVVVTLTMWWLS